MFKYFFLSLFLVSTFSTSVLAQSSILSREEIRTLIGSFPDRGSQSEVIDDEMLLAWQTQRTKAECENAERQENVTVKSFFGGPNGILSDQEIKALPSSITAFAAAKIGLNSLNAKKLFNRLRPSQRIPGLTPCIQIPTSTSYPSGHATYAWAMAKILAHRFPLKVEALMDLAEQASLNRVIGGVHHPSDIEAGKKLGIEIAQRILND